MRSRHLRIHRLLFAGIVLIWAQSAQAVTIEITVTPEEVDSLGQIVFTVGVQDDGGLPVDINGYTLDYSFDASELTFVSAMQLIDFDGGGADPFSILADCTSGRCTAGNTPGQDALGVLSLFTLTFDVTQILGDGFVDLEVGILNESFDGISQATGEPVYTVGVSIANSSVVPEPSTAVLFAAGLVGLALRRRRAL